MSTRESVLNMTINNPLINLEKLNYTNSTDWFQSVQDYFILNGLWSCLDDNYLDSNFDDFGNESALISKNLRVLAILRSLVDEKMKKRLNQFKDSKSAWQHLKSFYSNKIVNNDMKIVQKINDYQIEGNSLIKNFDQFNQFFNQFEKITTLDDFMLNSFCLKLSKDQQYKSVVEKLQAAKSVNHFRDILIELQTTNGIVSDFQSPNDIFSNSQSTNNQSGNKKQRKKNNEQNNSMNNNVSRQNHDNSRRKKNEGNDGDSIVDYATRRKNQNKNGQNNDNNSRLRQNNHAGDNWRSVIINQNGQVNDGERRRMRNEESDVDPIVGYATRRKNQNKNGQNNDNNSRLRQNNHAGDNWRSVIINQNTKNQRTSRDSSSSSMNRNDNYSRKDNQNSNQDSSEKKNQINNKERKNRDYERTDNQDQRAQNNQLDYGRTVYRNQNNQNRDSSPRNTNRLNRPLINFEDSDSNSMVSRGSDSFSSSEENTELNIVNQYLNELNKSNAEDENRKQSVEVKDITPSSSNSTAVKPPINRFYNATYGESKDKQKENDSDWSTSGDEGTVVNGASNQILNSPNDNADLFKRNEHSSSAQLSAGKKKSNFDYSNRYN